MDRSSRQALLDKTNFPGSQLAGRGKRPVVLPHRSPPPTADRRRALELGLTPSQPPAAGAAAAVDDDSFSANQSWAGHPTAAAMMPWDTPPMRRPKPDATLLKGDNLFSFSFNGATARSPYRCQQRASDAAGRSLNDSWAFYKSFSPSDVLTAQTLFITPTKSVFTIDSRTSQILMWNDMAADLLGYSGAELSQLRLKELFVAAESRPRMEEAHLSSEGSVVVFAGNVVEVMTKRGDVIPVSLWLRKIETSSAERRCVAVLEPVQRKTVQMTCDRFGRLSDVSGCVSDLFSQEPDEFIGLKVTHFIPSLKLPSDLPTVPKELRVQEVTAKRLDGSSFPVSVRLAAAPPSADAPVHSVSLRVHAYTSLMGLVVMDEHLKIRNYNHNFISLTVGYEKGALIGKDIRELIPTFEEDMEMLDSDDESLALPPLGDSPAPHSPAAGPVQGDETQPGNITYDLCTVGLDDDSIVYCLWVGQDRPEPRDSLLSGDLSAGVAHFSLGQRVEKYPPCVAAA
ncbi:PAS domain-containing serine/threonine-protein kinase-like [Pollicipes pollicipes]|uniref:PAS domain-containing serine/threonine-protein kinase-like n=1 Tax=Pollicipes pollicipes TaxID=41117 RepID=UPI0018858686|nr:PAS domain-containing serine/threonine-protein kinase-like [Pollicipes pollicipes]